MISTDRLDALEMLAAEQQRTIEWVQELLTSR